MAIGYVLQDKVLLKIVHTLHVSMSNRYKESIELRCAETETPKLTCIQLPLIQYLVP